MGLSPAFRSSGPSAVLLPDSCLGERLSKPRTSFWTVLIFLFPPRSKLASCFWPALAQKVFRLWMAWTLLSCLDWFSSGVLAGLEEAETDPVEE